MTPTHSRNRGRVSRAPVQCGKCLYGDQMRPFQLSHIRSLRQSERATLAVLRLIFKGSQQIGLYSRCKSSASSTMTEHLRLGPMMKLPSAPGGGSVPSAYKYQRTRTTATVERGASDRYLTDIYASETFDRRGGDLILTLHAAQTERHIAFLSAGGVILTQPKASEVAK